MVFECAQEVGAELVGAGLDVLHVVLLQELGEESLGEIFRFVNRIAASPEVGLERVPVGLAQHGERLLRRGGVFGPGGVDHAPPRGPEIGVAYVHAHIVSNTRPAAGDRGEMLVSPRGLAVRGESPA